jgi:lipoprotein
MFSKAKKGCPGKDSRLLFNALLWIACSSVRGDIFPNVSVH